MALANEEINAEAERRRKEEERRKKQAPRGQTVAVPRGEVGSFSKAYQGYKFVEEGTPESRRAMNLGEFTEKEAQRRFEEKRGKDWVGQMEARVREGEPQRAREALATVAQRNKALWEKPLPSALQEDRTLTEINLPGGGRVKYSGPTPELMRTGRTTLARMREVETEEKKRVAKEQARVAAAKEKIYADRYTAATQRYGREMDPKKRYEAELAEKGFTVPKTREEENRFNKERMADFTTAIKAKEVAKNYEKTFRDDYIAIQRGKRQARQDDNSSALRYWQEEERALKSQVGDIDPRNVTQTRRFFEEKAANEAKDILNQRFERRKKSNFAQNTSNPEAASVDFGKTPFWMTDFSPAPESYSDFVNRTRVPRIPEKGAKPQAPRQTTPTPTEGTPAEDRPFFPPPEPFTQIPLTSTERTPDDFAPGISEMPPVERQPDETPAQYNQRVIEQLVLPSFSEEVRNAYTSAKELNEQEKQLFKERFLKPDQYKEVAAKVKEQHDIIKREIDELRRDSRKYPERSRERAFKEQQIAVLQQQLGFWAKRFY
jgi:hypothetical protein